MPDSESPDTTNEPITTNPVLLRIHEIKEEMKILPEDDPRQEILMKELSDITFREGHRTIVKGDAEYLTLEEFESLNTESTELVLSSVPDSNRRAKLSELAKDELNALLEGVAHTEGGLLTEVAYSAADPVIMFNGEFMHGAVDIVINGAGVDFAFRRTYKNKATYRGPLGHNWDHNYNLWIRVFGNNLVRSTGSLKEHIFTRHPMFGEDGFDYWVPPDGQNGVIFLENNDSFIWRAPNGVRHFYEQSLELPFLHRIARMEDKFGNHLTFMHDEGRLVQIEVNHPDRVITLQYDSTNRIIAVQDYTNRRWQYCYDNSGDLERVTTPSTDQHEKGLTVCYEYSSDQFLGRLQHNLTRIIDAEGQLYLENEYGIASGDLSYNRVVRQRQGHGNSLFEYADVIQDFEFDYNEQNRPAHQTKLMERNGHEIRYVFNRFGNLLLREECILSSGMPRLLRWRYRYNRDGALRAVLTPEGRMTQYLYGRELFLHQHGLSVDDEISQHDELTMTERQSFRRLLAVVRRTKTFGFEELNFSQGVWGDIFPDIFSPIDSEDIVLKLTYEGVYGQLLTISDPRFTESPDPEHPESPDYSNTLTTFSYRGQLGDFNLFIDRIVRPTPTLPDGVIGDSVIERFTEYDEHGRLLQYINSTGTLIEYSYFESDDGKLEGYLKKVVADPGGLSITTEYKVDDLGRSVETTLPRGVDALVDEFIVKREFNALNQLVTTISPRPFEYKTSRFYDKNGNVVRIESDAKDEKDENINGAPQIQTFSYDEEFNLIQATFGGADLNEHLVTTHCYDIAGNRVQTVLPKGNQEHYAYDERMLPVAKTKGLGHPEVGTERAEYDGDGRLHRIIDARGFATTFFHDAFNNVIAVEDALGNIIRRCYDKLGNLLVERVFERREDSSYVLIARSQFEFDELGRLIQAGQNLYEQPPLAGNIETDFLESPGPGEMITTQIFYDSRGRVVRAADPLFRESEWEYDALDRPIRTIDPLGNRIENQFDEHGNLVRQDVLDLIRDPTTNQVTGERVFSATSTFDELDRPVASTDSLGNTTRFHYDSRGNVLRSIDPLGNVIRKTYDIYGRLIKDILEQTSTGLGDGLPLEPIETDYEYDVNGNLLAIIDALGRRTTQRYDALDRLTNTIYPGGQKTSFKYDAGGNLIQTKDNNGLQKIFTIDPLGRLSRVAVDRSMLSPAITVEGSDIEVYTYDALSRRIGAENDFARSDTTFNSLGWPISETLNFNTPEAPFDDPLTLSRTFSRSAALMQLVYPNGRTLQYERDALDRLLRINNLANGANYPGHPDTPDVQNIAEIQYTGKDRSVCRFSNGASITYQYDGGGALIQISHRSHDEDLLTIQYLYDGAGNPRFRNDLTPNAQSGERLAYDSVYRLVNVETTDDIETFDVEQFQPAEEPPPDPILNRQAEIDSTIGSMALGPGSKTFEYDKVGNRQLEQGTNGESVTYTLNALNQYTDVDGTPFSYDLNGNLMSDGVRDYFYDARNRLVRVAATISEDNIVRYFHDANGRRVLEIRGDQAIHLIYNGPNVIAEYQEGVPFAHYVHDSGIDRPFQIAAEGGEHWYHADVVASARILTDRNGDERIRYEYTPFGKNAEEIPEEAPYNPFLYTARRFDAVLALYDYRSRQYDPALGRFLQRDPSGMVDGPNLYQYAGNNPVIFVDPFGTERQERQTGFDDIEAVKGGLANDLASASGDKKRQIIEAIGILREQQGIEVQQRATQLPPSWRSSELPTETKDFLNRPVFGAETLLKVTAVSYALGGVGVAAGTGVAAGIGTAEASTTAGGIVIAAGEGGAFGLGYGAILESTRQQVEEGGVTDPGAIAIESVKEGALQAWGSGALAGLHWLSKLTKGNRAIAAEERRFAAEVASGFSPGEVPTEIADFLAPAKARVDAVVGSRRVFNSSSFDTTSDWSNLAHANSYGSVKTQSLYVVESALGESLKYGTTFNLAKRYTTAEFAAKFGAGAKIIELARANVRFIRDMERRLIQRYKWLNGGKRPPKNMADH